MPALVVHLQLEGQLADDVVAIGAHNVPGLDSVDHGSQLGGSEGDVPLIGLVDTAYKLKILISYFKISKLHTNFKFPNMI